MHELSLMAELRELVVAQVEAHGGGRVERIRLRIGTLAGVEEEALRFAHPLVMAGSCAEGSRLEIETVPALCHCSSCEQRFSADAGLCACPRCGAISRTLLQGRELDLVALELRQENTTENPAGQP